MPTFFFTSINFYFKVLISYFNVIIKLIMILGWVFGVIGFLFILGCASYAISLHKSRKKSNEMNMNSIDTTKINVEETHEQTLTKYEEYQNFLLSNFDDNFNVLEVVNNNLMKNDIDFRVMKILNKAKDKAEIAFLALENDLQNKDLALDILTHNLLDCDIVIYNKQNKKNTTFNYDFYKFIIKEQSIEYIPHNKKSLQINDIKDIYKNQDINVSMGIGNVLFNIDKDNIKACVVNNIDLAKQFILEKTFNGYKYNIVYAYVNQTLYKFNRKMVALEDLSAYKK